MPNRILVVDDERNITDLLKVILGREGYEVDTVFNGLEALDLVKDKTFNLIILDVQMPKLDGWGVLSALKSSVSTRDVPVIMCTNQNLVSDVERAENMGASGYILKPFNFERLLKKIKQVLNEPQK